MPTFYLPRTLMNTSIASQDIVMTGDDGDFVVFSVSSVIELYLALNENPDWCPGLEGILIQPDSDIGNNAFIMVRLQDGGYGKAWSKPKPFTECPTTSTAVCVSDSLHRALNLLNPDARDLALKAFRTGTKFRHQNIFAWLLGLCYLNEMAVKVLYRKQKCTGTVKIRDDQSYAIHFNTPDSEKVFIINDQTDLWYGGGGMWHVYENGERCYKNVLRLRLVFPSESN